MLCVKIAFDIRLKRLKTGLCCLSAHHVPEGGGACRAYSQAKKAMGKMSGQNERERDKMLFWCTAEQKQLKREDGFVFSFFIGGR